MSEEKKLLIYRAITPLHCGASEAESGIDLPVVRERTTGFPIIPATSLKGVWRDTCSHDESWKNKAFGAEGTTDSSAGKLNFVDGQLLYLPVRSSVGTFLLLTCPQQLRRYSEWDNLNKIPANDSDSIVLIESIPDGMGNDVEFYLEDVVMKFEVEASLNSLLPTNLEMDDSLKKRLCVVSDSAFSWFCNNALEIVAHNKLKENKKSENLWYEEAVPTEAIFFAPVLQLFNTTPGDKLLDKLIDPMPTLFQVGGHESVGRGLMKVSEAKASDQPSPEVE